MGGSGGAGSEGAVGGWVHPYVGGADGEGEHVGSGGGPADFEKTARWGQGAASSRLAAAVGGQKNPQILGPVGLGEVAGLSRGGQ